MSIKPFFVEVRGGITRRLPVVVAIATVFNKQRCSRESYRADVCFFAVFS
jgi:hypothetical protein